MAQQTTGLGLPLNLVFTPTPSPTQTLSLGGTNTFQLNPTLTDAAGNTQTAGTVFTLTAAANASSGTTTYTGTITGGGSNAFADLTFVVAGFDNSANNGTFLCTASTTTTLVLDNSAGVSDTHAATATCEELTPFTFTNYSPAYVSVSSTGLVTGLSKGQAVVEASYPWANNSNGNIVAASNIMNGTPSLKLYKLQTFQITN